MMARSTAALTVVLLAAGAAWADDFKSGPQVGEGRGGFQAQFSNGIHEGKKRCPVWVPNYDLVAMIFVREINDELTGLVKKLDKRLDESMAKHKPQNRLGVFVILLGGDAKQHEKYKELLDKGGLKQVVLCTTDATGEQRNKIAREAEFTVAVYRDHDRVATNFALKKCELDEKKAEAIYAAIDKVVPK